MNEIHRVLAPEGLFFCRVPAFPSTYAFKDPTHVNFITEDTFPEFFCLTGGPPYAAQLTDSQGNFIWSARHGVIAGC